MGQGSDLKRGSIIKYNGENHVVLEHTHVTPGKGPAHHQTKLRNLKTGKSQEARFRPNENVEFVRVENREYQYLYKDGDIYYFMSLETYEQIPVGEELIGDQKKFLKENEIVNVAFEGEEVLDVNLPLTVELEVTHTEPGVKGDTATNVMKPATVETGAEIQVPIFINEGDVLKINTQTGEYSERVSTG